MAVSRPLGTTAAAPGAGVPVLFTWMGRSKSTQELFKYFTSALKVRAPRTAWTVQAASAHWLRSIRE